MREKADFCREGGFQRFCAGKGGFLRDCEGKSGIMRGCADFSGGMRDLRDCILPWGLNSIEVEVEVIFDRN